MAVSTFGKAFSAARAAGKKSFNFGGKSYNTKTAPSTPKTGPVPAKRPSSAPATVNSNRQDPRKVGGVAKAPVKQGVSGQRGDPRKYDSSPSIPYKKTNTTASKVMGVVAGVARGDGPAMVSKALNIKGPTRNGPTAKPPNRATAYKQARGGK